MNKALQRADKVALSKIDPTQIYHIFPDQREGSSSALVLKKPKTKKSSRTLYLTRPLKEELLAWLEKLRQDELAMDGRYRNCGQLFRLPNGVCLLPRKPFLNGTALGVQSTRSLRRSCSTVCATPVPLTS